MSCIPQGDVQGRVRCWQYLPDSATLLLSMRDNRWCANVGRAHRSNGIFYSGMCASAFDVASVARNGYSRIIAISGVVLFYRDKSCWPTCQHGLTSTGCQLDALKSCVFEMCILVAVGPKVSLAIIELHLLNASVNPTAKN